MISKISRIEFQQLKLSEEEALLDPIAQLERWWNDAIAASVHLLDAVHLSTVDEHHQADARIVLLKHFDERGLVFFTNYNSPKARELSANPSACMIIFWPKVERQIRVRGQVEKTSREESEIYFRSRPQGAQIGAWASQQSSVIKNRDVLEAAYAHYAEQFKDQVIPCPPNWGGFRLVPTYFEFWQGRQNRLHDRISYDKTNGSWELKRLSP